jgi:hypothetical protein
VTLLDSFHLIISTGTAHLSLLDFYPNKGWRMDRALRYPQWQRLLDAAILEFDPVQLCVKLQEVEVAISTRLRELTRDDPDEHQALAKALVTIQVLEKNRRTFYQWVNKSPCA